MFKVLITTRYGEAIHTVVVEFLARESALYAVRKVNEQKDLSYNQRAIALGDYE